MIDSNEQGRLNKLERECKALRAALKIVESRVLRLEQRLDQGAVASHLRERSPAGPVR